MKLPNGFKKRIQGQLLNEADLFFSALDTPAPVSVRLNPYKPLPVAVNKQPVLWSPHGFYLESRPAFTLDPALHAGMYYVQEAASMSIDFVLKQLPLNRALALDLCAAPGGKSSLLASHLWERGGMLLSNEVIRSRAYVLKENMVKWGLPNVAISNLDPERIGKAGALFDLVLVDAPCSGEGMFRKDEAARAEWSPEHVALCSARQKRILSDILPALKTGGFLLYSTCTFAEEENEQTIGWLQNARGMESVRIEFPTEWGITEIEKNGVYGYAFYPHRTKGEGFFIALLKKTEDAKEPKQKSSRLENQVLKNIPEAYVNPGYLFYSGPDGIYGMPAHLQEFIARLQVFPLFYPGNKIAEAIGKEWKPAPELAFLVDKNPNAFPAVELEQKEALQFLRRDELKFPQMPTGWLIICYMGQGLGFVKNLGNRSNSQYPKEWRVLMNLPGELPLPWYDGNL